MSENKFNIRPVSGALGAEISGIDLSLNLDDAIIADLRGALLEHLVLFFRDQEISPQQHVTFARRFADLVQYPMVRSLDDHPDIVPVVKLEGERVNFGGLWHADTTYLEVPPMGAILCARELPPQGGDTLFANMYLAYDNLSPGLKSMLGNLVAINTSAKAQVTRTREDRVKAQGETLSEPLIAEHPVIRTHPETGRKLLFMNYGHTVRFKDMTEAESEPLLNYLFAHQTRPEFTCRFNWSPGSVVFYDNRATQHNPINDYHGYRRILHRVTLAGTRPV
jgi:taurine dioxygenase